jgi:hypothetical protein
MMGLFDDLESAAEGAVASAKQGCANYLVDQESHEAEQKSREWFAARLGKITASRMNNIAKLLKIGKNAGEFSAAAETELMTIAIERTLTDEGRELYITEQMGKEFRQTRWGNKWEASARAILESSWGIEITEGGFKVNAEIVGFGGSVDGIAEDYVIEIKCPHDPVKHERTLRTNAIDRDHEYYPQIQSHLMNWPDKKACLFLSFDPRRDATHALKVITVERDNDYIEWLKGVILKAEEYINGAV